MAIQTSLQRSFSIRMIAMAVVTLVLGLWGIYDYAVKIPAEQRAYHRLVVCQAVKDSLETTPGDAMYSEELAEGKQAVADEMARLLTREVPGLDPTAPPLSREDAEEKVSQVQEAINSLQKTDDSTWVKMLIVFNSALQAPRVGDGLTGVHQTAFELSRQGVNNLDGVSEPGKFDRMIQWAFILCLPFAPYYFLRYFNEKKKVYRLDDDGSLHTPQGDFAREEIVDLDMDRWMAKSIAHVETKDDARIKLDDYIYKNMHLIVGALAQRFAPDKWTEEAKKIDPDAEAENDSAEESVDPDADATADESTNE